MADSFPNKKNGESIYPNSCEPQSTNCEFPFENLKIQHVFHVNRTRIAPKKNPLTPTYPPVSPLVYCQEGRRNLAQWWNCCSGAVKNNQKWEGFICYTQTGWWFKYMIYSIFTPTRGNDVIWLIIFVQMDWNHQLAKLLCDISRSQLLLLTGFWNWTLQLNS